MKRNKKAILTLALCSMLGSALAGEVKGNFTTNAQIEAACTVNVTDFNFGVVSYKNDTVILGTLSTICNKGIVAIGTLSKGNSSDYYRYMTDGSPESDILKYNISVPAGSVIGDGTGTTKTLTITGTGQSTNQWLSATLLRGQYVKPGNYSDSLTFTLTY